MSVILFIDGRNFLEKMEDVFEMKRVRIPVWSEYNFKGLLDSVLNGIHIQERVFYFGRLREHPETKEKSQKLIHAQRMLKTKLEYQGFQVLLRGAVRGNLRKDYRGNERLVFKEKGVDVSIAVDIAVAACAGKLKLAIIGSSDSDLQPAIKVLNDRSIESIYLGFEQMPNKGLTATTKRTILIRNSEIIKFAPASLI